MTFVTSSRPVSISFIDSAVVLMTRIMVSFESPPTYPKRFERFEQLDPIESLA
jgi:hypothetical protein